MDGAKTADSAMHQHFGRRFHPVAEQYAFRAAELRAADGSGLDFVDDEIVDMGKAGSTMLRNRPPSSETTSTDVS